MMTREGGKATVSEAGVRSGGAQSNADHRVESFRLVGPKSRVCDHRRSFPVGRGLSERASEAYFPVRRDCAVLFKPEKVLSDRAPFHHETAISD